MTGAGNATNATTTGDAVTTGSNQTVGGPLALYAGGGGQSRAATFEHTFTEADEYPYF